MKPKRWYQKRLGKYFDEHYGLYEDTAEYYVDPDVNQWMFNITELNIKVKLICHDDETVEERRYYVHKKEDKIRN